MKDISKYTPKQLRNLANKLEKEKFLLEKEKREKLEKENNKPIKQAVFKQDMYYIDDKTYNYFKNKCRLAINSKIISDLIRKIENSIIVKAGTKCLFYKGFVCKMSIFCGPDSYNSNTGKMLGWYITNDKGKEIYITKTIGTKEFDLEKWEKEFLTDVKNI
jgi:hypothetical protein